MTAKEVLTALKPILPSIPPLLGLGIYALVVGIDCYNIVHAQYGEFEDAIKNAVGGGDRSPTA